MKLYDLFKGTEYVGEFTLDEIASITGAHRSALLNSVAHILSLMNLTAMRLRITRRTQNVN